MRTNGLMRDVGIVEEGEWDGACKVFEINFLAITIYLFAKIVVKYIYLYKQRPGFKLTPRPQNARLSIKVQTSKYPR